MMHHDRQLAAMIKYCQKIEEEEEEVSVTNKRL
jgi:hypothetical protein